MVSTDQHQIKKHPTIIACNFHILFSDTDVRLICFDRKLGYVTRQLLFLLSKILFTGSTYPKKMLVTVEDTIADAKVLLFTSCEGGEPKGRLWGGRLI